MKPDLPVWRSMLFVPATNDRLIRSAMRRDPDAFQIDLEDSVPPERKQEAREALPRVAEALAGRGADIVVRINRAWRLAVRDLEAAVGPHVDAINLPKTPDASHVRAVGEILSEIERERGLPEGRTRLLPMIETAEGLENVRAIARASERVVAITIGAEDLALDLGMEPDEDGLYFPSMALVTAARAAGILPIGYLGTVAQFNDRDAFAAVVARSRRLGFAGGFCIHPNQIDILNAQFSPDPDELAFARELVDAYERAIQQGLGAVSFRDRMIDQPVAERARALLVRAARIREKNALKSRANSGD